MPKKIKDNDIPIITERYLNFEKISDIAKDYDVSPDTITYYLRKNGIQDRRKYYGKYSKEDVEEIIELYINNDFEQIFKLYPEATKSSIYAMASKLGYKKANYFWSDEDVEWLKINYGKVNSEMIVKHYNGKFTWGAIRTKAGKLGLCQPNYWTKDEEKIIADNYSVKTIDEMLKLLPGRSRTGIMGKARSMGLKNYTYLNQKYSLEQKQFIAENFQKLTDEEMATILKKPVIGIQAQRQHMGLYVIAKGYTGYENLAKLLRGHMQQWKNQSMESCNYQCVITGSKDFEIHHIYSFNQIFRETMEYVENKYDIICSNEISDYTEDQLNIIIKAFQDIHSKYPLGVCIRSDIHALFHKIYGSGSNTQSQWDRFMNDLNSGIYKNEITI